jgi:protocatechuate 3,4-dioxygenase beta subunit
MTNLLRPRRSLLRQPQLCRFVILAGLVFFRCPPSVATQSLSPQQAQFSIAVLRIAGTIVNAIGGNPLGRARVTILDARNPKNVQSMITAEDGRFEFKVGTGKYALQGAKRGFITAAYDEHEQFSTALVTGTGFDTENLVLRLAPSAVLSGKILDESRDPVRRATVSLYREDRRLGVGRILRFRVESTDDQGAYEFSSLDAGTYFISVTATPWYAMHPVSAPQSGAENLPTAVDRSLDVAYPVVYYGDSAEADDATPIPVRGGDRLQAEIHLNPVAALHLLFHAPDNGANGVNIPMLQVPSFDGVELAPGVGTQSVSPGLFEITGVAPGRYSVRMSGVGQENDANEIDLTSNGQELDAPSTESASDVKASVQVLGDATLPSHLEIGLRSSKGRVFAVQAVDSKGEVEFQNVAPGTYEVLAWTPPRDFAVMRISSQGSATSGHVLNVAAGSSLTLSLSLVGGVESVEGFAKRAGKAAPGAMVVLVPKDSESNLGLFRRDQSDQDGSFSLRSVIPGSYTLVAIENGWDLDWSRPGVIAHYAKHGQGVTVSNRTQGTMHLPDSVEVQPR